MLENQYGFSANAVTVTQVVANLGAMTGGTVIGYLSQMFGRRLSIIFASIVGGALIYPYGFTGSERVIAPAFFEQAMVQGVSFVDWLSSSRLKSANVCVVCTIPSLITGLLNDRPQAEHSRHSNDGSADSFVL
jgi:MFS-type transporter involved in bile tolerance (Atg22 family)